MFEKSSVIIADALIQEKKIRRKDKHIYDYGYDMQQVGLQQDSRMKKTE
ncbi:MAG: hypothetical protein LBS02_19065 [Hungatella sp.]|jgi:hypothetical protein|nr:hypothetical protein [Hungatella sp.]